MLGIALAAYNIYPAKERIGSCFIDCVIWKKTNCMLLDRKNKVMDSIGTKLLKWMRILEMQFVHLVVKFG